MSFAVLDTDVASRLLKRTLPTAIAGELAGKTLALTFATVGELTKWTVVRSWGPSRRASLQRFVDRLVTLPYDEDVARRWGQLQARAQLRGRPRPQNDTWIAACCLVDGVPLATLNFEDFAEHEGLRLIGRRPG